MQKQISSQHISMNYRGSLDDARVKRIFALMQANYGTRWVQQTGTGDALRLAQHVWAEKLAGLSDKQIIAGLNNLPEEFPPTPAKFRSLCKMHSTTIAAHRPFQKLIEKKSDITVARRALKSIREIMSRNAVNA